MSPVQTILFTALWLVLLALAGLLLLLYRQVARAYSDGLATRALIAEGSEAPTIEVVRGSGFGPLEFSPSCPTVLTFMEIGCSSCNQLLPRMKRRAGMKVVALFGNAGERPGDLPDDCEALWLAHPHDVLTAYEVSAYPTVVVVRDAKIDSTRALTSVDDFDAVLDLLSRTDVSSKSGGDIARGF